MIKRLAKALVPASIRAERDRRIAQRNWTEQLTATAGKTRITFCIPAGLGDRMIARQFLAEFERLAQSRTLGLPPHVVIVAGAWSPRFTLPRGDLNIYWWWSMGGRCDWLQYYMDGINRPPDLVLCLSQKCQQEALSIGVESLYVPLAVGPHFRPPEGTLRKGIGFAGSRGHKDTEQVDAIIGPFRDRADFQWVDHLRSPQELAAFYGGCGLVLGMTERLQEEMGMVNNRVFEVLATDTPFLVHRHRELERVLGFPFPYQSSSAAESVLHAEEMLGDAESTVFFREAGRIVREQHSWQRRIEAILEALK